MLRPCYKNICKYGLCMTVHHSGVSSVATNRIFFYIFFVPMVCVCWQMHRTKTIMKMKDQFQIVCNGHTNKTIASVYTQTKPNNKFQFRLFVLLIVLTIVNLNWNCLAVMFLMFVSHCVRNEEWAFHFSLSALYLSFICQCDLVYNNWSCFFSFL